jgi:Ricin-type beta-trefoil lectin domain-like
MVLTLRGSSFQFLFFIDAFSLSVQHTNMNLDTRWGTKRSSSRLMQWSKNASSTQKWLFIPVGNGYFKIINKASGRALSINGGTSANTNNAYLVQLNYEGLASQQWRIEALP